ncbi:MAG: ACP S-malonyltransferase, partial [Pseudomonadota bacterium]
MNQKNNTAIIFPGQGSQFIGMGKDLFEHYSTAREVFEEVDDSLQQNLSKIIFTGDVEELNKTANTQPALMAVSMAIWRVINKDGKKNLPDIAKYVAGHSLGEYSALTVAESILLSDAAKILRIRGNAMQEAVPMGQGSMAALIGADHDKVTDIIADTKKFGLCEIANDNGGGQIVISGAVAAVEHAIKISPQFSVRKAVQLPVSAPFHCSLMEPAAVSMQEALEDINVVSPIIPLIANVNVEPVTDPIKIKKLLVDQVTSTVRWRETINYFVANEIDRCIEIGAGKVLSGIGRRIDKSIDFISIQNVNDIENV